MAHDLALNFQWGGGGKLLTLIISDKAHDNIWADRQYYVASIHMRNIFW
jgi:hypothetical protein